MASERSQKVSWLPKDGFIESQKMEGFHAVIHLAGANVAEGRWTAGQERTFVSSRLLVKHDNDYEAPPSGASGPACPDDPIE